MTQQKSNRFSNEELRKLLADRDHQIALLQAEVRKLRGQVSDYSWQTNPDRMGGAFTEEEKNRSGWY